ncbi:hypothetical protein [Actinoplanes sp. NPDC026619]|uniref:hypothetical protein n=1 Tax=Actinoplanes sp. NPDC026619 TaxID=3155798 RepID=UPI0033E8BE9E
MSDPGMSEHGSSGAGSGGPRSSEREPAQRSGRNRKIAVGAAAALAVVIGGGAYLIGSRDGDTVTENTNAIAPVEPATPAASSAAPATTVGARPKAAAKRTPSPQVTTTDPAKVRRQIEAARSKAAAEGHPLQRPLTTPPRPHIAAENVDSYTEETRPLADGGTLRIVSARYDLSGQREMLWAADSGTEAGAARCTQNFRFAQGQKPAVRKTMLLCWRNTADRSVVVLAVGRAETPDTTQVLNVLDTQWNRL